MLIRINNTPLSVDSFAQAYVEIANEVTDVITQPLTMDISVGNAHLISADMNPINAPQHFIDAVSHLIDYWVF